MAIDKSYKIKVVLSAGTGGSVNYSSWTSSTSGNIGRSTATEFTVSARSIMATASSGYTFQGWSLIGAAWTSPGTHTSASYAIGTLGSKTSASTTLSIRAKWITTSSDETFEDATNYITLTYQATFAKIPTYTVTTSVNPSGYGRVTGAGTYQSGTSVTISATAYPGYKFKNLVIGSNTYTSSSRTITVSANTSVTANFEKNSSYYFGDYRVRIVPNVGTNGTLVEPADGDIESSSTKGIYWSSSQQTASGKLKVTPKRGYTFNKWTQGTTTKWPAAAELVNPTMSFNATSTDQTVTAKGTLNGTASLIGYDFGDDVGYIQFPLTASYIALTGHTLTTSVTDSDTVSTGSVSVSPTDANNKYYSGESVTLTATQTTNQSAKYEFWKWTLTGGTSLTSTTNPLSFNFPNANVNAEATFRGKLFNITFDFDGGSGGTTSAQVRYGNTPSTLASVPTRTGYKFLGYWDQRETGGTKYYYGVKDSESDSTITPGQGKRAWNKTKDTTLYARWEIEKYAITTKVSPGAGGTVTGAGTYDYNSLVTLTQTPNKRYKFVKWSFNGAMADSTSSSTSFYATKNLTATANYELDPNYVYKTSDNANARFRVRITPAVKSGQESWGTVSSNLYGSYANITEGGLTSSKQGTITATANQGYVFKRWKYTQLNHSTWNTSNSTAELIFANGQQQTAPGATNTSASVTVSVASKFVGAASMVDGEYTNSEVVSFVIEAEFEKVRYKLNALSNVASRGSVSVSPTSSDGKYEYGTNVTVTATPNYGYYFQSWNVTTQYGGEASEDNPYTFSMPYSETTAVAQFDYDRLGKFKAYIYASSEDTNKGTITKPSDGNVAESDLTDISLAGETLAMENIGTRLQASPNAGYHFKKWVWSVQEPTSGWSNYWDTSNSYVDLSLLSSTSENPNAVGRCEVKFVPKTNKTYTNNEEINIAIKAQFEENTNYNVTASSNNADFVSSFEGAGAQPYGKSVTVKVNTVAGVKVTKWELWRDGVVINTKTTSSKTFTFTMPESDVTAKVTLEPILLGTYHIKLNVVSEDTSKGTVTGGGAESAQKDITIVGETATISSVPISATGKSGYVFHHWNTSCSHTGSWNESKSSWGTYIDDTGTTGNQQTVTASAKYVGVGDYVYDSEDEIVTITLTAVFVQFSGIPYILRLNVSAGSGGGVTTGKGTTTSPVREITPEGVPVSIEDKQIACQANTGYHFVKWTKGEVSWSDPEGVASGSSCTVTVASETSASTTVSATATWKKVTEHTYDETRSYVDAPLVATFAANNYTVTLNKNGGTGGTSSVTATYGSPLPSITVPTRQGYVFQGYFNQAGDVKYYNAQGTYAKIWDIASNSTLYAQWSPISYTISYSLGGGSYGTYHPTSADWNSEITISNPTYDDREFLGWTATGLNTSTAKYGDPTATTTWSNGSTKVTAIKFKNLRDASGTVTLTANWKSPGLPVKVYINNEWKKCNGIKMWDGQNWILVPAKKWDSTWID